MIFLWIEDENMHMVLMIELGDMNDIVLSFFYRNN